MLECEYGLIAQGPHIIQMIVINHSAGLLPVHIKKSERFIINRDRK